MSKYSLAVADCRITQNIKTTLSEYADSVVLLPMADFLSEPVSSHPDMLLWRFENKIVAYDEYAKAVPSVFDALKRIGYEMILEKAPASPNYPYDVPLNCASVGKYVFANKSSVSAQVRKIIDSNGIELLHTKQGYAKCSTVTVSDNAIITADPSIYAVALKNGIDALFVESCGVGLNGYDHGFIGGASGVTDTHVLFSGDLSLHPSEKIISDFCKAHNKTVVSLSSAPLYDYGTIMFF